MNATKPLTATAVQEILNSDTCSRKQNTYTARWGFFYRHGGDAEHKVQRVLTCFPHAKILDSGEVWKAFNGGAPIAKQSHWFVTFTLDGSCVAAR